MTNRENRPANGGQPQRRTVSYPAPHSASPAARRRASQEGSAPKAPQSITQPSVWDQSQQKRQQASKLNAERSVQRMQQTAGRQNIQRVTERIGQATNQATSQPARKHNGGQRAQRPSASRTPNHPPASEKRRTLPNRRQAEQGIVVRRSDGATSGKKRVRANRGGRVIGAIAKTAITAAIVLGVIGAGGIGVYTAMTPASFNIKVNNELKTVSRFTSINSLIKDGIANPVPGDHLAVDGSVLEEGGGVPYHATVNGEEPRFTFLPLSSGDEVVIRDGDDTNEDYTSTEQVVAPDQVEEGTGAIHAYIAGTEGLAEVRTGKESGLTAEVVITPAKQATFYEYNADTGSDKVIALTFDDGPWEGTTDQVLDILDRYGIKATFFTIGDQIADHKESILRMHNAGHQICTHSWSHASGSGNGVDLTRMTAEEQIAEVTKGLEAIEAVTGAEASRVFRAPGGNYTGDIVWTLQEYVSSEIGWNIDTADWRQPGAEAIARQIMNAKPGQIVLMHDGGGDRSQTVAALEMAIPYLQEQGYTFVTMDELLAYNRAVDMMAQ